MQKQNNAYHHDNKTQWQWSRHKSVHATMHSKKRQTHKYKVCRENLNLNMRQKWSQKEAGLIIQTIRTRMQKEAVRCLQQVHVWELLWEWGEQKPEWYEDKKKKKRKHSTHVSGGAGIPPEPQLTRRKKTKTWQTSRAEIPRWHNFTGFQLKHSSKM